MNELRLIDYIALGLGILGIAVSVFLYFRSKVRLSLSFRSVSVVIITPNVIKDTDLTVEHEGDGVVKATLGSILIWNSGNKTLTRDDFAPSALPFIWLAPDKGKPQPPRQGKEAPTILTARVERVSHAATAIRVNIHNEWDLGDHILLGFDHLAPGDGALVSVLYDQGQSDTNLSPSLEGHLRTGRDVTLWTGHKRWDKLTSSAAFALLGLWFGLLAVNRYLLNSTSELLPTLVQGLAVLMLFCLLFLRRRFGFGKAKRILSWAYQERIKKLYTYLSRLNEA